MSGEKCKDCPDYKVIDRTNQKICIYGEVPVTCLKLRKEGKLDNSTTR